MTEPDSFGLSPSPKSLGLGGKVPHSRTTEGLEARASSRFAPCCRVTTECRETDRARPDQEETTLGRASRTRVRTERKKLIRPTSKSRVRHRPSPPLSTGRPGFRGRRQHRNGGPFGAEPAPSLVQRHEIESPGRLHFISANLEVGAKKDLESPHPDDRQVRSRPSTTGGAPFPWRAVLSTTCCSNRPSSRRFSSRQLAISE